MKKIILILSIFFVTEFAFSNTMISMDYTGYGIISTTDEDCFKQDSLTASSDFSFLSGGSGAVLWEFNSESMNRFHLYTGLSSGAFYNGISLAVVIGGNTKVAEFGPIRLELNFESQQGVSEELANILFGDKPTISYYSKNSFMMCIMNKSRKGIFGGVGLTDCGTFNASYYKNYGTDSFLVNYFGVRLLIGYRF